MHNIEIRGESVMKKEKSDKKKEWILDMMESFEIPKETVLDVPIISLVGDREIVIENFISIVEYGDEVIRLKTQCGEFTIEGKNLDARSMDSEHIQIKGKIQALSFGNRG